MMMHRALGDLAVKRIDQTCGPIVEQFLLLSGHQGSHVTHTTPAAEGGPVAFGEAAWTAGAFHKDELRGLISISDPSADEPAKVFLLVDPMWRRKGVALALIEAAKAWAMDQGMENFLITCSRSDWPTRSLLERIGARLDLVFGEIVAHVPIRHSNVKAQTADFAFAEQGPEGQSRGQISEALMLAVTNAPLPSVDCGGQSREVIMRPTGNRFHVSVNENEMEKRRFGPDALGGYNQRGIVVVASAWLALYVAMSFCHLTAPI
jgi:GNAT superfamily N-acetyltransferase